MLDRDEYIRWLASAEQALKSAVNDMNSNYYNWACFKAQQAAEFAVKALLRGIGKPSYGHSISRLLLVLEQIGIKVPEEIMENAKYLDKLYVPTRYPNAWSEGSPHEYYTRKDSENAIRAAELIINWVRKIWKMLSESVRL